MKYFYKKIIFFLLLFLFCFYPSIQLASSDISNDFKISSQYAIIFERNSGCILYEKNAYTKVPMASTTKIMTCLLILEKCNLNDLVTVSKNSASIIGSRLGLNFGDTITVNDLLYGMMLCSGNDAAVALAEHCSNSVENFAILMNEKADELNLNSTHFVTPHGLDNDDHYTTAYDFAILTNYALNNPLFRQIVGTTNYTVTVNNSLKLIHNTNDLLNDEIYGVKTGFTSKAGRCLVTAASNSDLDIIVIVFGSDTKNIRNNDSKKLVNYAFENFKNIDIKTVLENKYSEYLSYYLPYTKIEKSDSVIKTYLSDIDYNFYTVNSSLYNLSFAEIEAYDLVAPIAENQIIGKINLFVGNSKILSVNIHSSGYVERISPANYIKKFLIEYKNLCMIS